MKLSELWPIDHDLFLRMERWVNDGSPSGWTHGPHQVSELYRPTGTRSRIELPTIRVPATSCTWFGDREHPVVRHLAPGEGDVLYLPVHPDVLDIPGAEPGPVLSTVPTSSARTVAWPDAPRPAHLKLHYPGLLGRAPRELNRRRVGISVATSEELVRLKNRSELDEQTDFLPEPSGAVFTAFTEGNQSTEIGFLVRDATPLMPRHPDRSVLPYFALTSQDRQARDDEPLLAQLARWHAWTVDDFVESLIAPLLRSFFELSVRVGIVPEMHGQNIVVEIDHRGQCTRVVHRDFLDMVCDPLIRNQRSLGVPDGMRSRDLSDAAGVYDWRSWAFDFKLGQYTIEPAVALFSRITGMGLSKVRQACADQAHRAAEAFGVSLHDYFLPWDYVRYLDDSVPDWSRGPVMLRRPGPIYR